MLPFFSISSRRAVRATSEFAALSALALGLLTLAGCAQQTRTNSDTDTTAATNTAAQQPPERFTLSITVLDMSGRSPAVASARSTPTWGRPSRYLVEGDWVLRSAVGPVSTPAGLMPPLPTDYPPMTRQLTTEQASALWSLVKSSGMMDGSAGQRVNKEPDVFDPRDAARLAEKAGGGAVMLIEYRAGENYGTLVASAAGADAAGLRSIVTQLAQWAWVE